jgi:hypothetical protein
MSKCISLWRVRACVSAVKISMLSDERFLLPRQGQSV